MSRSVEIELQPSVLRWARERSSLDQEELARRVSVKVERVQRWEETGRISLAQVAKLAAKTYTPEGFLFLPRIPEERIEIPDLRTVDDRPTKPSPNLLDTVRAMKRRQAWMREELTSQANQLLSFVGSAEVNDPVADVASAMRERLDLRQGWAGAVSTWVDAIRLLRERAESAGILVVMNGIVGNNTRRKLNPDEFRGFALVDEFAPLIFVNGADYKSAQMFTLAHELAHVWLNASGISNADLADLDAPRPEIERRCNAIAAEFLIPSDEIDSAWPNLRDDPKRFERIARKFKTSQIVAARRAIDIGLITRSEFFDFLARYQENPERGARPKGGGGDFWNNQRVRIGSRFGHAVAQALDEGRMLYQEAYALTGLRGPTFDKFVERLRES